MGNAGDGLGVVDDGGSAVKANHGWKRRLDARNAALAFERLHQRRLLAYFVGSCTCLRDDIEIDARSKDVLAQKALRVSVRNRFLHDLEQIAIFTAQVDEAHLCANG